MTDTLYLYTFSPLANVDDSNGGNATGIFLYAGQYVTLTTPPTDTWNWSTGATEHTGPDGDMSCIFGICTDTVDPTQPNFALLYRIGTSPGPSCNTPGGWALAGSAVSFVAQTSGELYLIANDRCGEFGDNSGSLTTTITVIDHYCVRCHSNHFGFDDDTDYTDDTTNHKVGAV